MPRDLSGNYTLPVGNPVVNATTITPAWGNGTMSDIANQLNNVLTRDGLLAPIIPMVFPVGAVGAPSIAFAGSLTTGVYSPAANKLAFATAGVKRIEIDASGAIGINTAPSGSYAVVIAGGLYADAGVLIAAGQSMLFNHLANQTWNPAIFGGITAGSGSFIYREGKWNQIGKLISAQTSLVFSSHTGTGNLILPLPAAVSNLAGTGADRVLGTWYGNPDGAGFRTGIIRTGAGSTTTAQFLDYAGAAPNISTFLTQLAINLNYQIA